MPTRRTVALLLAAVSLLATCTDDDEAVETSTTATTAPSLPSSTAPPATPSSAPSRTTTAVRPTRAPCSRLPRTGAGSLEAIADEPAGTAISHVPRLSALAAALDAAGLLDDLDDKGPLTLFAPVNAAFHAIPPADLDAMLTDTDALDAILRYHAIGSARLNHAELARAGKVRTLEGQPLTFRSTRRGLTINGGPARVICADVPTANATIHLIDAVLMPPPAETDLVTGTVLYSVDLETGAAMPVGPIGDQLGVIGMSAARESGGSTIYGLTDVPELITFDAANPKAVTAPIPIRGVAPGSTLLAIDVRPANGALMSLSDAGVLYTIDPATGAATAVGPALDPPLRDPGFGFDVDPAADRIRVDVATGENLSVDPATGAAEVDGDLAYDRTDAGAGTAPRVVAAAYTPDGELFAIDVAAGTLTRQDPPGAGTLATVGPLGVDLTDGASFDITASGEALLASPG